MMLLMNEIKNKNLNMKTFLFNSMSKWTMVFLLVLGGCYITLIGCEETLGVTPDEVPPVILAASFCDTLQPVRWADTLLVVPRTITTGKFKGKDYWQAMLYSDKRIEPTSFANTYIKHRVVIADTIPIYDTSVFYISRIK